MRITYRYHKIGIVKCDAYHRPIKVVGTYELNQSSVVEKMLTILNDGCNPEHTEYIANDMTVAYTFKH